MKELSIEEKANAYDKVREKIALRFGSNVAEDIFSEFKISEDEKIRKAIINIFATHKDYEVYFGISVKDIRVWLEKQSEQKPIIDGILTATNYDKIFQNCNIHKFNVGDWVVFNNKHQSIYQIEKIENGYYILRHTHGGSFRVCVLHDESLRLWSIEDAKEGDILANKSNDAILIFKNIQNNYLFSSYCDYFVNTFRAKQFSQWASSAFIPATKEQRETLFAKIKDAGYEFDFKKKELKKFHIIDEGKDEMDYCFTKMMNGEKISSTCSEEDKIRLDRICKTLWKNRKGDTDEIYQQEQDIDWLKAIIPGKQWKPSKEQIIALRWVLNNIPYNKHKEEISGLLDQIKDL